MKMKKVRIAFIALSLGMMGFLYAPAPAQTTNPPEEEEATNPDDIGGEKTKWYYFDCPYNQGKYCDSVESSLSCGKSKKKPIGAC